MKNVTDGLAVTSMTLVPGAFFPDRVLDGVSRDATPHYPIRGYAGEANMTKKTIIITLSSNCKNWTMCMTDYLTSDAT